MAIQHVLQATNIPPEHLCRIFTQAQKYSKDRHTMDLKDVLVALMFYEHSESTESSFEAAISMAGGKVIKPNIRRPYDQNVEDLADTLRALSDKCDCIVLRHPSPELMAEAVEYAQVPVINAGSGQQEHPAQALTDMFTIWDAMQGTLRVKPRIEKDKKLHVLCWGNNRTNRAVRSTMKQLGTHGPAVGIHLERVSFYGNAPHHEPLSDVRTAITEAPLQILCREPPALEDVDIVYATNTVAGDDSASGVPEFTPELAEQLPQHAMIMGPLPRTGVLPRSLDSNERAWYFKQSANGLRLSTALIRHLTTK